MPQRSKRPNAKPPQSNQEKPSFSGKSHDISKKESDEAKKPPTVTPEDNYEREAGAMPKDIQRLATPLEDEKKGGTSTKEEKMRDDKKNQE